MADVQEAVRRLSIEATEKGVDEVTDKLKEMGKAQAGLAVTSEQTDKASLSLGRTFDAMERKYVAGVKAQQNYEKVQRQVNAAVAQNPALADRANAVLDAAKEKFERAASGSSVFSRALSGVQGQLVALAAGAGPVGTFLAGFGPAGLAAAVAVGGVTKAIDFMIDAADRLASKAQSLQALSIVTRLTTDDLQILQNVASNFGLTGNQVGAFIDRFTQQLTSLRNATGPLYDMIQKINPEIAQQMLSARDTATEIQLLAKAYNQAGSDGSKLLSLAAGRGGSANAPLIGALGDAGSIAELGQQYNVVITLTGQYTDQLAKLKAESDDVGSRVKDNIAAIFAGPILQNQVNARKEMEQYTNAIKNFTVPDSWKNFVDLIASLAGEGTQAADNVERIGRFQPPPVAQFGPPSITYSAPQPPSAEAIANQYKTMVQYLGSAASAQEMLKVRTDALKTAFDNNAISADTYNRAVAALKNDSSLQLEAQRLGILGSLAAITERVTDQENRMYTARQRGVPISAAEIAAASRSFDARLSESKLNEQANLGAASSSDIASQKLKEFQTLIGNGTISLNNNGAAANALSKKYEDLAQRSAIAGAALPGLKSLEEQAGSLRGQLDTAGTTITNGINQPLSDMTLGLSTSGDAIKNFEQTFARALTSMVINMTVTRTVAQGLQMVLGAFLPAGVGPNTSIAAGPGSIPNPGAWDGIAVGTGHVGASDIGSVAATRYVHPAYFDDAPRHHSGTPALGFNEIPFVGMKGEEIGWPDQLAKKYGGGTNVTMKVNITNNAPVQVEQQQSDDGMSLDVVIKPIEDAMAGRVARGVGSLAKTNKAISNNNQLRG